MSEQRHTPGPWGVDYVVDGAFQITGTVDGDQCVLATRAPFPARHFEFVANAHLIAAAPDLYVEAVRVVDWLDRLAARADEAAKDRRFPSLADANAADAKNYRASAKGLRAALAKAEPLSQEPVK